MMSNVASKYLVSLFLCLFVQSLSCFCLFLCVFQKSRKAATEAWKHSESCQYKPGRFADLYQVNIVKRLG